MDHDNDNYEIFSGRRIFIERTGDLFIATSPDEKGLLVAERSLEELRAAVLKALSDLDRARSH